MELNDNPYGIHERFVNAAKAYLINEINQRKIDISIAQVKSAKFKFETTDLDMEWDSEIKKLLDEETIFELDLIWMKMLNP